MGYKFLVNRNHSVAFHHIVDIISSDNGYLVLEVVTGRSEQFAYGPTEAIKDMHQAILAWNNSDYLVFDCEEFLAEWHEEHKRKG